MSAAKELCNINEEVVRECSRIGVKKYCEILETKYTLTERKIKDLNKRVNSKKMRWWTWCIGEGRGGGGGGGDVDRRLREAILVRKNVLVRLLIANNYLVISGVDAEGAEKEKDESTGVE